MNLKTILLSGAFALLSITFIWGQSNINIGVRGGLTVPNLMGGSQDNPLNTGYSTTMRWGAGIFAEFKLSQLFSIQPMLEFSEQGAKKNGFQALPTPDELAPVFGQMGQPTPTYLYADFKSNAKFNYLMLPVLAKFGWNFSKTSPFRIYVDAGPFIGLLVSAKQVISGGDKPVYMDDKGTTPLMVPARNPDTGELLYDANGQPMMGQLPLPFDRTENIKNQLHPVNFGVEGNVGLQYQIKRHFIFIEGGGNYGLLNIQKGTANGKNHSGAATVMVGYAFALK
ncbi:MAG: PorT family protein [Candidatus Azobacteroides sp.]|nr:PorT family protein [Candidatus Azobacteroides sp.]